MAYVTVRSFYRQLVCVCVASGLHAFSINEPKDNKLFAAYRYIHIHMYMHTYICMMIIFFNFYVFECHLQSYRYHDCVLDPIALFIFRLIANVPVSIYHFLQSLL